MQLSNTGQLIALTWVVLIGEFVCSQHIQAAYSYFVGFIVKDSSAELFWLASTFLLLGGGFRSELGMQYASLCDAVPEDKR